MREFRIKVNNEKTYVVKANDYNQAVKTLHSKLRDFDDTKKNINVVREFITNNGGKFSESKDADAILDFIYKKTGVKNADYGDVLYIIRNYTNVKVEDNAVSDSISRYTGEDAIRTNGFVKIKEEGDWTSYKYNGSDFDNAVFKIHQYNPSLIAFVSNGNRTITVRNKYLKDSSITDTDMKTAEEIIKKYGGNPVGNVMGLQKTRFVGQDEIKNPHDFATDLDKAGYKFYLINGRYRISPKNSSIKDVSYVSGKNLKIGQKIVEDGEVLEVVDIKETQRGVNNNYRDVTFKNVKTGATETVHFVNSALARLNDYSPKYNKGQKIQTSAGIHEIIGYDPVKADANTNRIEYSYRLKTPNGTYTNIPDWQLEELVKLGHYKLIDSSIKDDLTMVEKYKKSIIYIDDNGYYYHTPIGGRGAKAYRDNTKDINIVKKRIDNDYSFLYDSSIKDVDWDFANKLKQHSQEEIRNALKYSAPTVYKQYRNGETIQFVGLAGQLTGPEKTKVLKRLGDSNILSGYKYRIINNGTKWYYETTFPDGHTTLTGPYSSKQETEQYFHKHRPTEKLTDADPVKVEKIIRKEKSALGITYYIFQTKSSSGYTIYYQVTDKTYHGEPTYSGGGIISVSLKSANDTLDHNLLMDKLKAKYGEKEGTKRYLRGENDSAIKDKLSTSDANSLVEAYIDKYKYTHSNLPYVNKPKIKIFNSPEEFRDKFLSSYRGYSIYAGGLLNYNGYVVKLFTSAKDGKIESPSADNIFTIFPTTAIKDSNNIKNRISYDDLKRTINRVMEEGNDKDIVNILIGQLAELKKDYEKDINNSKLDKEETKQHYNEYKRLVNNYKNSHISKEYTNAVNSFLSAIKDSDNIKNRKSYTIKVGDKQYKIFAESEEEAVDKYIKSKKQ